MKVTFVLTGDNRSGGVRVTMIMGNLLRRRGHDVRIIYPSPRLGSVAGLKRCAETVIRSFTGNRNVGWLHEFQGRIEGFADINKLRFQRGEIVIAVGTYTIQHVARLRHDVIKIRYNHGLPANMKDEYRAAWTLPMPTITVSSTLAPQLEELTGEKVLAVIPNGIDVSEYYCLEDVERQAIGTIYNDHANKAPHDIILLLNRVGEVWPEIPRVVFSTCPRPADLKGCHFERFPPVERARELYNQSLIWLLASYNEGLPGPVLEAMACGCVVISTDNDGSLEIIRDGGNGLIVPRGDIEAFVDKIALVLRSPGLRRGLVEAGLETARRFSWAEAADKMEAFLEEVGTEQLVKESSRA